MNFMNIAGGGVTSAQGFMAGVAQAAIKKPERYDVALVYSMVPAAAAGVFTTNKFQAAPVLVSKKHLEQGMARGFVINSGCANACTGEQGMADALCMARKAGEIIDCPISQVLVASTGVIGVNLPMKKVEKGIAEAGKTVSPTGGNLAAQAIMTTDTFAKEYAVSFELEGNKITIGGMAKGAGMIHPNMATLLGFVTTDAAISSACLREALREANESSFNMITVDGDTSTNDSLFILANGLAGNQAIADPQTPDYQMFVSALKEVCVELAKMIARDGEGATKLIEVQVVNAPSLEDARLGARAVAGSTLLKAAIFGEDANWGRIICALGYSGAQFVPELVDVYLGDLQMARDGGGLVFDEAKALAILKEKTVLIKVDLKQGSAMATAWGCDLTYDYVKINGAYRT